MFNPCSNKKEKEKSMKKEYINPELCVIEVETQGMLAASQVTSLAPGNSADLDFEDDGFDDSDDDL